MKHLESLTRKAIAAIKPGEEFTYTVINYEGKIAYHKGLKLNGGYMIPVGLYCSTIAQAQKQK